MQIEILKLSTRVFNALKNKGINTVEELVQFTPGNLANIRNWGDKCLFEVRERLLFHDLCLAGDTIISSKLGIQLIKDITNKLDNLEKQINIIRSEIGDILTVIDKIRICTKVTGNK